MPVNAPLDDPIVAVVTSVLLHVPPAVLLSVAVAPSQRVVVPVIAAGIVFTVAMELVVLQPMAVV